MSHWFVVSGGKIISWRGARCLRTSMSLTLTFDIGRNTTTLSEFIGYLDLTDFPQISPKLSGNKLQTKQCREILIFEIFAPWRPFTQHALHIFCYSNFRCRYLDNQLEYRKSLTHEVDGCLVNKTVRPFCSCCDIR